MKVYLSIAHHASTFYLYEQMILLKKHGFSFKNHKSCDEMLYMILEKNKHDPKFDGGVVTEFKNFVELIEFTKLFTTEISYGAWLCQYKNVDLLMSLQ